MTNTIEAGSGECTCFVSALRASEQLHQVSSRIQDQSLDRILIATRQAVSVVHQYSLCLLCSVSSRFLFYTLLLRQATECYSALLQLAVSIQRPITTIKLQVGAFSVDASMETSIEAVVFGEVRRTTEVISNLGDVLHPELLKDAKETWDKDACAYQLSIIQALKNDTLELALSQRNV
ncbi:hypothetical protein WAI453_001011 [Rhynchosporium graminicola]|uniref:Fungal N-terminal domain-containing protein n=2 Tax=Rhynchosporium TaxID=38037 RepID=A0A1E1MTT9_RHYSE|nr:uncharacterized protein RCO7_14276 [Rhynchosporium commune]CZT52493.1 uncharacterized protein RSE6_13836 [Rhynchosporium secalis]